MWIESHLCSPDVNVGVARVKLAALLTTLQEPLVFSRCEHRRRINEHLNTVVVQRRDERVKVRERPDPLVNILETL